LLGGTTLYDKFEEQRIHRCVQNKIMLKYAKNHLNLYRNFEDISRRYQPSK